MEGNTSLYVMWEEFLYYCHAGKIEIPENVCLEWNHNCLHLKCVKSESCVVYDRQNKITQTNLDAGLAECEDDGKNYLSCPSPVKTGALRSSPRSSLRKPWIASSDKPELTDNPSISESNLVKQETDEAGESLAGEFPSNTDGPRTYASDQQLEAGGFTLNQKPQQPDSASLEKDIKQEGESTNLEDGAPGCYDDAGAGHHDDAPYPLSLQQHPSPPQRRTAADDADTEDRFPIPDGPAGLTTGDEESDPSLPSPDKILDESVPGGCPGYRVGDKFKCGGCGKVYSRRRYSDLKRHYMAAHTDTAPAYTCEVCGERFQLLSRLQSHAKRRGHTITRERHVRRAPVRYVNVARRDNTGIQEEQGPAGDDKTQCDEASIKQEESDSHEDDDDDDEYCEDIAEDSLGQQQPDTDNNTEDTPRDHDLRKPADDKEQTPGPSVESVTEAGCDDKILDENIPGGWAGYRVGDRYKCGKCERVFEHGRYHGLKRHYIHAHTHVTPYTCDDCGEKFKMLYDLKRHVQKRGHNMTVEKPARAEKKTSFPCPQCGKVFKQNESLKDHMHKHTGERPYMCCYCSATFSHRSYHRRHEKNHGENWKKYPCPVCDKIYKSQTSLEYHKLYHHGSEEEIAAAKEAEKVVCDECGVTLRNKISLHYHKKFMHGDGKRAQHKCEVCGNVYHRKDYYLQHIKSHDPNRCRFPCAHARCGKTFLTQQGLKLHDLRDHQGIKLHECKVCGKDFASATMLAIHNRNHTGEKPYACEVCGKRWTNRTHYKRHRKTHEKEEKNTCRVCGQYFKVKAELTKHLELHRYEGSVDKMNFKA